MFTKIKPSTEDYSCSCCEATMPDFVLQDLADHGNQPTLLYRDLRRWVEDGFARFAGPLLDRLLQIEGPSKRYVHARDAITAQIRNSPATKHEAAPGNAK
jgi:hypothetical protein